MCKPTETTNVSAPYVANPDTSYEHRTIQTMRDISCSDAIWKFLGTNTYCNDYDNRYIHTP